jgi:hypothetical protein
MAVCPNTAHPDWKALEKRVGRKNAISIYAQNGYKIPVLSKESTHIGYDVDGQVFKKINTMERLDRNPVLAKDIIETLKSIYPNIRVSVGGMINEKGNWIKIPAGEVGMHRRNAFIGAVAWANDSYMETPPHEYAHDYIEMFQEHPMVKKAIEKYGVEELAIYMGKDFAQWVAEGKQNSVEHTLAQRIWKMLKSLFGIADVREKLAENFRRGRILSNQVHPGTGIYNYQEANRAYERTDNAADLGDQFDNSMIDAVTIDEDMARFYIAKGMSAKGVIQNEDVLTDEGFINKQQPINSKSAMLYFIALEKKLKTIDVNKNGDYHNAAYLDKRMLKSYLESLENEEDAQALVKQLLGINPPPTISKDGRPKVDNYEMTIRIMQRINYVQKTNHTLFTKKGKAVDLNSVHEQIQQEVRQAKKRREDIYNNMKIFGYHPKPFVNALKFIEKKLLRYQLLPHLATKLIAGSENTVLFKLFYDSLNEADTKKLRYLREYKRALQSSDTDVAFKKWSHQNQKKLDISEYVGETLELYSVEDPMYSTKKDLSNRVKLKLTNAEMLSLYMTLRQQESKFRESLPPGRALAENGFYLDDQIKGREYSATTKFLFTESTSKNIIKYVEDNAQMMDQVAAIDKAMNIMHGHVNSTFLIENGFELPKIKNYFPVATGKGISGVRTEKRIVSDYGAGRARLGENKPLKISDVNKVVRMHGEISSLYASHALPISNNRKMLSRLKEEFAGTDQEQYVDYMEGRLNLLEDPQNLHASRGEEKGHKLFNKLTSNFAVSVLSMNLPVMMKQPVSFLAAKEEIDSKYLRKAGWGAGGVVGISPKQIMKSLKWTGIKGGETKLPVEWHINKDSDEYKAIVANSPKLAYRMEGSIDRELGEAMIEENTEADKIKVPRILGGKIGGEQMYISKSRLMEGIKVFDTATIMGIWKAVELETADRPELGLKKGTQEYNDHIAMRTEMIVNKTQPTYDLMNRSELSTSVSPYMRLLSMFGSARVKLANLIIDGVIGTANNPTKENKRKLYRRVGNVMVLNAIAITAIDALRQAVLSGFDDDDELSYNEEVANYMKYSTIGNSMGAFYLLGDGTRIAISKLDNQPWTSSIQHPVFQLGTESFEALTDIGRIGKTNKRTGEYDYTIDDGLGKGLGVALKATGLPYSTYSYPKKLKKKYSE